MNGTPRVDGKEENGHGDILEEGKMQALDEKGTDFLRSVARLVLDEWKIVGETQHLRCSDGGKPGALVDFKQPQELEVSIINYLLLTAP